MHGLALLAPSLVLTARHCVAENPDEVICGVTTFGATDPPEIHRVTPDWDGPEKMDFAGGHWFGAQAVSVTPGSALCGYDLLEATTRAKVLNLATNVAALAAFLAAGRLDVRLGLAMGAASLAGHSVGAHLGVKKGAAVIRPVVLLVCAGLFVKLAFDAWSGR
ncbi:MAG: hypothetical protein HY744_01980 [Deltaproteobacteria bacterium]|nr:hypothetical protein [Deltaproteobacteria bacterium]